MLKQISDPVLGSIKIENEIILEILNTKEFSMIDYHIHWEHMNCLEDS